MNIINALKITLLDNGKVNLFYIFLFLFFVIAFIFFFIELQVLLTPEPDNLSLYLKIWRIKDWLIVGLLSILVSLNFIFFVYLIKIKSPEIKSTSTGIFGTLLGIFSAILVTALCSSCLAVLFSLLGISFSMGIFFLKYKFLIFIISSILLLISLHFQSKIIIEKCRC
jgi:high-affinity Fe2+/Pb2+ permease